MSINESNSGNGTNRRRSKRLINQIEFNDSKLKKAKIECSETMNSNSTHTSNLNETESSSLNELNFISCEGCGKKFVKKSPDQCDNCSTCEKINEDMENIDSTDLTRICENCKENTISPECKMFGCMLCSKYYHVNCLLKADIQSDLKFKNGQFVKKMLRCIRCDVVQLCYKVKSVIAWRWRESSVGIANPEKYYMSREFLVHYNKMSYWDCEWIPEVQLEISETHLYWGYKRKCLDYNTPPNVDVLSDCHKRKLTDSERDLHEKYFKWGIEPEWLQPQKVLAMDNVGCFVKWRDRGYEYVSAEPLSRVKTIDGLQEAIDQYKRVIKELSSGMWTKNCKSKLIKLSSSPDYLGPVSINNSTKPALHPYQLEGLNWLRSSYSNDINTILADEMGLGKTIQAIALLYSLYKDNICRGPFLIAVPLSTLKNWEREIDFWAPDFCVVSYYGEKDVRATIREKDMFYGSKKNNMFTFHVLLTTYELMFLDESFLNPIQWEILIVDEAHRLKNKDSKLFKSLKKYKLNYRILMTGTPLQNNLEELFHLLNFMEPESFGDMSKFLSQFEDVSKEEQVRTLQDMLKKHLLRRLKSDVFLDLPTKEEQIVRVELTAFQKKLYKLILTKNVEALSGKFNGIKLTNIMMQLRKCCNHPFLLSSAIANENTQEDGSYNIETLIAGSGKMSILQKMLIKLRENGHKVLIFSGMTKLLDILEHLLDDMEIEYERIDGNIKSVTRQNAIDRFNNSDSTSMVFLLSTKAGGLGINLCAADTVFIYDADWNPQNDIQALSRAHRIGQKRKVMIYRFVTRNSVEEKVMESAKRKMMVTNLVVKSFTKTEFHQILSFGTKYLFDEDCDKNDQKIIYDDAAIDQLLDRNRAEVSSAENNLLDSCFSGFKVAQYQFASETADEEKDEAEEDEVVEIEEDGEEGDAVEIKEKIDENPVVENASDYWTTLLGPFVKSIDESETENQPALGKGQRRKLKVHYNMQQVDHDNGIQNSSITDHEADPDDTDYDISEGEREHVEQLSSDSDTSSKTSLYDKKINNGGNRKKLNNVNMERDFKDLAFYGIGNHLHIPTKLIGNNQDNPGQLKYFSIIDGFMPKERVEIFCALMNYGLPPKTLRKGDVWWPNSLDHKTVQEMDKFLMSLMSSLCENCDSLYSDKDRILQDDIDYDTLLARIGLNGLINFKVNQYESLNRTILEIFTYKQWNVKTISTEELTNLFDELKYIEFDFIICDGGFSSIHNEWNVSSSTNKDLKPNPTLTWNKLHDYYLLSAIASHGYDRFFDKIFLDPQYQVLFIPFRMDGLDLSQDNLEIRKFIRNRQKMLENALLLEAQLIKIGNAFDERKSDWFSYDRLIHYHEIFVKQQGTKDLSAPSIVDSKQKISAIAQLELLINDIESNEHSLQPISLKMSDNFSFNVDK